MSRHTKKRVNRILTIIKNAGLKGDIERYDRAFNLLQKIGKGGRK